MLGRGSRFFFFFHLWDVLSLFKVLVVRNQIKMLRLSSILAVLP